MTKLAYLECPTGLAGDMCLGALVHAGVPLDYLIEKLSLLNIADEYQLWAELVHRNGQQATKVRVELVEAHSQLVSPSEHELTTFADRHSDPSKLSHTHSRTNDAEADRHSHSDPHSGSPDSSHNHSDPHSHSQSHSHSHHHSHSHSYSHHHNEADSSQPDHHQPDRHHHKHANRHLPEITAMITAAGLPARVEAWSLAVFRQLAEAEGAVHGIAPDQVHFHEVGATDAIVDIVGTCLGLDWLEIDELYCSAIPVGGGTVRAAHGLLPVPAPAVLKLLEIRQVPIYSNGINRELVTPTGAAIVTTLSTQFGPPPSMTLQRVGLGAGSRNLAMPNILRLWVGIAESGNQRSSEQGVAQVSQRTGKSQSQTISDQPSVETIVVLETQIDDLNPQAIGYVFEVLFAAGALDVFTQAIGMKKSRPGVLLTVICHPDQADTCESIIFRETTTLGIRRSPQQRSILDREIQTIETIYGIVRVKVAHRTSSGTLVNAQPEYEDCAALARQAQIPWHEVHRLALYAWHNQHP